VCDGDINSDCRKGGLIKGCCGCGCVSGLNEISNGLADISVSGILSFLISRVVLGVI
jgi:hypothetical protein